MVQAGTQEWKILIVRNLIILLSPPPPKKVSFESPVLLCSNYVALVCNRPGVTPSQTSISASPLLFLSFSFLISSSLI